MDRRQFQSLRSRLVRERLEPLGYEPRKSRWGGLLYVRHCGNQLHGICVEGKWPLFQVRLYWHYTFIPSVARGETPDERRARGFDVIDFIVEESVGSYWRRKPVEHVAESEDQVVRILSEEVELALKALDEIGARFRDPRALLELLPPSVFRYRVYDIDGSDKGAGAGKVGRSLVEWLVPNYPFAPMADLLEFLQLLAVHEGDEELAGEYARVSSYLKRWFQSLWELPLNQRFIPVVASGEVESQGSEH